MVEQGCGRAQTMGFNDRFPASQFQHGARHQRFGEHDISTIQRLMPGHRQQVGLPGPGADDSQAPGRGRCASCVARQQVVAQCLDIGGFRQALFPRATEEALPEVAPGAASGQAMGHGFPQRSRDPGDETQPRLEHKFDLRLDPTRENRRRTLGANRHHHRVAIDQRRGGKIRNGGLIGGTDEDTGGAQTRRQPGIQRFVAGRGVGKGDVFRQVEGQRVGAHTDHAIKRQQRRFEVRGDGDYRGFGFEQQAQLGRSLFAATEDDDAAVSNVDEQGEGFHGSLRGTSIECANFPNNHNMGEKISLK